MSFKFLVSNARRSGFSTSSACGPSSVFPALDKTALTDPALSISPELQNSKGVISEFRIITDLEISNPLPLVLRRRCIRRLAIIWKKREENVWKKSGKWKKEKRKWNLKRRSERTLIGLNGFLKVGRFFGDGTFFEHRLEGSTYETTSCSASHFLFWLFFWEEVKNGDLMSRCLIALRGPDRDGQ